MMLSRLRAALGAQPATKNKITNPEEIDRTYKHWRVRMLYSLFIGYAVFYFVRKNISLAIPGMISEFGYSKAEIGILSSTLYLTYGLGKFGMGILGDRANPRYFMAIGLALSALVNIWFGLSSSLYFLALLWGLNGVFQAMGWPPCARGLTQWYSASERGTFWGIWNASHNVGGAIIVAMAGWLTQEYGWRSAFYVPAAMALVVAVFLVDRLRDTPPSLGLPPVEEYRDDPTGDPEPESGTLPMREILFKHVLTNKYIWALGFANFFVYIVRYGAMDWAPTFLHEVKGSNLASAGFKVAGFEMIGMVGAFAAGYISDRWFKGRRGPLNVLYMLLLAVAVGLFWLTPPGSDWLDLLTLSAIGFLVYGPQMLVGVSAVDVSNKHSAATATGFTGLLGYLGAVVSGVGAGWVVDKWGWDGGFRFFIACGVLGALCFALTWKQTARHLQNNNRKNHAK